MHIPAKPKLLLAQRAPRRRTGVRLLMESVVEETGRLALNGDAGRTARVCAKNTYVSRVGTEILPREGERNILITSALPYVNNVPHLGNLIGSMLSADVYARYCRRRGYNTLYICGTDEYGTATETKALEEGLSCQALCDKYHTLHIDVYKWFGIEFDHFGRTATQSQTEIAQDIFLKLHARGLLLSDRVEQLYCEHCARFLADRYVEGICPLCRYADARGDQCDECGRLLNAIDLVEPRCKVCRATPVCRTSEHLFLDLPRMEGAVQTFVSAAADECRWSGSSVGITRAWLAEGLKPRCITRDLKWGTPVPLDSMADKVLYVWFDAPIGYVSITAEHTKEWRRWWQAESGVELVQFMGKDNVPFHTVVFPASLFGTGDRFTMLHRLSTTEYLQYEGGKFSKSRNTGVFGNNVQQSGLPPSVWRYYLLSNRPEQSDTTFSWDDLGQKLNTELLANLGNLVNRVLKFISTSCGSVVPECDSGPDADMDAFLEQVSAEYSQYVEAMEAARLKAGLKHAMEISSLCNQLLAKVKLDTSLLAQNPLRCGTLLNVAVNAIYLLSALLDPFIPDASESIIRQLNAPPRMIAPFAMDILPGHVIGKPMHMFKRIDQPAIELLRSKYRGNAEPAKKPKMKKAQKPVAAEESKVASL